MKNLTDYIIVGGGPSGLTFATICVFNNKTVTLIDKNKEWGGCHRVERNNSNIFSEHGPRVYSNNYLNFITLFKSMNFNFNDYFVPYDFSITTIGGQTLYQIRFLEFISFIVAFIKLLLNSDYGKQQSMFEFMKYNKFSDKTIDYINRVCLLTDGADMYNYSLNEFLQLFNQNFMYQLYQPNMSNDKGFIQEWVNYLKASNLVKFYSTIDVLDFKENTSIMSNGDNKTTFITVNGINKQTNQLFTFKGSHLIFAIPPKNLEKIVKVDSTWVNMTNYGNYIPMSFTWSTKQKIKESKWGMPMSNWGIAYIILSDYFKDYKTKTLISTVITMPDKIGKYSKKKAINCTKKELEHEIINVLKELYPELTNEFITSLGPGLIQKNSAWYDTNHAFMFSPHLQSNFIDFKVSNYNNVYNLGTHNGKSYYSFTSLESAVTNALFLAKTLKLKTFTPKKLTTIIYIILIILSIIISILFVFIFRK
jgi:hypothetical protein